MWHAKRSRNTTGRRGENGREKDQSTIDQDSTHGERSNAPFSVCFTTVLETSFSFPAISACQRSRLFALTHPCISPPFHPPNDGEPLDKTLGNTDALSPGKPVDH